ncbi:MAG: hypothetical protein ACXVH6_01645 [Halobacteriota archaeon]
MRVKRRLVLCCVEKSGSHARDGRRGILERATNSSREKFDVVTKTGKPHLGAAAREQAPNTVKNT